MSITHPESRYALPAVTRSVDRAVRGFALVAAIFLLVILAALGAFIVTLTGNQQLGLAQDVVGGRAFQAARAGLDWGICMMVKQPDNSNYCGSGTTTAPVQAFHTACAGAAGSATTTLAAGSFTGLSEFTVRISCSKSCIDEGVACPGNVGGTSAIYLISATACNSATCPDTTAPGRFYVERQIVSAIEQP